MCSALTVKRSQTRANTWCRTARPTKHEDAGVRSVSYTPHHGNVTKSICHCIRKTLYEKHVLQLHSETCDPCATDSHRACFATGLRTLLTSSSKSKVCWLCRRFGGSQLLNFGRLGSPTELLLWLAFNSLLQLEDCAGTHMSLASTLTFPLVEHKMGDQSRSTDSMRRLENLNHLADSRRKHSEDFEVYDVRHVGSQDFRFQGLGQVYMNAFYELAFDPKPSDLLLASLSHNPNRQHRSLNPKPPKP